MAKKNRNRRPIEVSEEQIIKVSEENNEINIDEVNEDTNVTVDFLDTEEVDSTDVDVLTVDTTIVDKSEVVENIVDYVEPVKDIVEPEPKVEIPEEPEVEVVEEVVNEDSEPTPSPSDEPIPTTRQSPAPIITNRVPNSVKTAIKDNTTGSKRYQIVYVNNGSPLQMVKTLNRLKEVKENFDVNDETRTITGNIFQTFADAVAYRKYVAGKGLKPSIKEID